MNNNEINNDEINIAELFRIIKRYQLSILLSVILLTIISSAYAYFAPNIYSSSASIYVEDSGKTSSDNSINQALGIQSSNMDNEIAILKSSAILTKALSTLNNIGIRYYKKHHLKTIELYQNTPFIVSKKYLSNLAQRSIYHIKPLSNNSYRLTIKPSIKQNIIYFIKTKILSLENVEKPIEYNQVHRYGENVQTEWFNINIHKVYDFTDEEYMFTITDDISFNLNSLSVDLVAEKATIIGLSFADTIPERAATIVNAITQAYINDKLYMKTQSAKNTLSFLDSQIAAINKKLQKSARNLEHYKSKNLVVTLSDKASLTAEKLSDLESKLSELNMQESYFRNIYSYVKAHNNMDGFNISGSQDSSPVINNLLIKIQEQLSLKKSLLVDYTEQHPDVIKITQSLVGLKQTLIQTIQSSLRHIEDKKSTLTKTINENKENLQALPEQERRLTSLTRNFAVNQKVYSYLLQRRAETAILESSTVSDTRVIDPAYANSNPIKPKRIFLILVGVILGFILGLIQAFIRSKLDNTVKSIEDIESVTTLPVYGVIPLFENLNQDNSAYKEALRVVRTNIEFTQNSTKSKLITMTSSVPMEGKTTLITEIAKIVAKTHKKAIVLDLDMRRARIHEKFSLPNDKGMSTLLAGKDTLNDVIQHYKESTLDIITGGPTPPNPSELIMSTKTNKIIEFLLTKYDYVFLDTPPIGLVSDAMMLLKVSDLNLFVLRANFSKKEFIKSIERIIDKHKLHNSGLILNQVKFDKRSGYGFGYGYGYGYSNEYYTNNSESSK